MLNAIRAKCLGKGPIKELKEDLINLIKRINDFGTERKDLELKFKTLFRMADGGIRDVNASGSIIAA